MNDLIIIFAICSSIIVGYFILYEESSGSIALLLGFMPIALRLTQKIAVSAQLFSQLSFLRPRLEQMKLFYQRTDREYVEEKNKEMPAFQKGIIFNEVSFVYPENQTLILKNCSFEIRKGTTFALVGESGAGKSTLLDLILKLYTPTAGNILVDDVCLSSLSTENWRSLIGTVSQDSFIFNDTIEFNIQIGKPEASEEEIIAAAQLAGAHDFIFKTESQYKTMVGERGYRLSGGERQRIALARALLRNPPILILDEATSNLDSESESFVQRTLETLGSSKTIIVVAHRLSTVARADKIAVIDNGMIIESGTHEILKNSQGKYAHFWNLQHRIFDENNLSKELLPLG